MTPFCSPQVGPYDHTVRKPTKGSVLAYWKTEEGLKAVDAMSDAGADSQQVPDLTDTERRHPPRRVDVSGVCPDESGESQDGTANSDEPSMVPQVSPPSGSLRDNIRFVVIKCLCIYFEAHYWF